MAEEIIDLRDRIEKMRIQMENEAPEQISSQNTQEIHHKANNSNISLSVNKVDVEPNYNDNFKGDSPKSNFSKNHIDHNTLKRETFPAVSLSVKNPVSSKILIMLIILQILSNIGILFFLYLGME